MDGVEAQASGNPASGQPAYGSANGSQAGQTPDWFAGLPAELAGEKSLQAFKGKSVGDFAKSFVEAQKIIGGSIRLPKADATPEDKAKTLVDIYTKLGRPESADKYIVNLPKINDGALLSDEHTKEFYGVAHKLGLNSEQLQGIMDWYGGYLNGLTPNYEALKKEGYEALKAEYGKDVDAKLGAAQRVLSVVGGKELVDAVDSTGIGNHPAFIKLLAKFGELAAEKGIVSGQQSGPMSKSDVQAEIDKLRNDPKSPYNDERHKEHAEAVKRMQELYKLRNA